MAAPRQTFLTHGEPEAANAMAGHIKEKFGWKSEFRNMANDLKSRSVTVHLEITVRSISVV